MRLKTLLSMGVLAAVLSGFAAPSAARADVAVSVSFFHQQLTPYGQWVVAGSYGNCWVPGGVAAGWSPYVEGQWLYTDYGWTWASSDPWGDIPYHYGTWAWVPPYGWVWVPGTVWAPAWVTWAYTDDYIGWAPVPPSFAFSVSGYVGGPVVVAQTRYVFVPTRQFVGVPIQSVRVAPQQNTVIFRRATKVTSFPVSNGIVRTAGPPPERVEKAAGHKIERVSIDRARTQPTSVERAGLQKGKTIPVVAPERERAQAIKAEKSPKAEKSAKAQPKAERETRAQAQPPSREAQTQARPQREAQPPERNAEVQHKTPEQKSAEHNQAQAKPKKSEKPSKPPEQHQAKKPQPPPEQVREAPPSHPSTEARAPRPEGESKAVQEAHKSEPKNPPRPAQKPKPQPKPEKPNNDKPDKGDKPGQN